MPLRFGCDIREFLAVLLRASECKRPASAIALFLSSLIWQFRKTPLQMVTKAFEIGKEGGPIDAAAIQVLSDMGKCRRFDYEFGESGPKRFVGLEHDDAFGLHQFVYRKDAALSRDSASDGSGPVNARPFNVERRFCALLVDEVSDPRFQHPYNSILLDSFILRRFFLYGKPQSSQGAISPVEKARRQTVMLSDGQKVPVVLRLNICQSSAGSFELTKHQRFNIFPLSLRDETPESRHKFLVLALTTIDEVLLVVSDLLMLFRFLYLLEER
jgi:hypothetical protein